jgi:anti-sigma factor RsiW
MTADPYARLDAAYLLGALDADERLAYEAHLAACRRCRAGLAEISAIPSLLAGLDESVFAAPPEVAPTPVPDTLLPRLLQLPDGNEPVAADSALVWACSPLHVRLR